MKLLLVTIFIAAAAPASAAPFGLDYRADPSCIDGARFSDEVSAKLGFVPWDPVATARIRIRVERDGEQFTGTFRNVDGSAKIVEGKTCADVTASLVVTVATAVDATPKAAPKPTVAPAVHLSDGLIPVTFKSVEGRRLNIQVQKASGYAVASNGTGIAAAYFDNLCTSPCTAGLPQGRSYLSFADPDDSSFGGGPFLIDRPTTVTLTHKSNHKTRVGLVIGGLAATGVGALAMSDGGTGPIVGGSLLLSVGLAALLATFYVHDSFVTTQSP
ncbi:MAG TPA: hypothetical protein VH143_24955 [Kofleriaceae bacterium]|jgi:hypothetical protein|nr:hypothetical protein [Kofleriaceae bacterium]